MAKYEAILVKYPYPDNEWWTAVCPAMPGCVSDGKTRAEALQMIADAMALYLEPSPGWAVVVLDGEPAQQAKAATLADCHQDGGTTEVYQVEPRFMTEEEIRSNPRFEHILSQSPDAAVFSQRRR